MLKKNFVLNNVSGLTAERIQTQVWRSIVNALISFMTGFLSSRAVIFDGLSPFGIAAIAASSKSDSILVLLGATCGYLLPYGTDYPARYIAASATVFIFKWLFNGFEFSEKPAFVPVLAAGAAGITGMAVALANGAVFSEIVLCLAETLTCGCAAVFFEKSIPFLKEPSKFWGLNRQELVSVMITICVILLALSGFAFSGISLGRIAGVMVVLTAARYGGEAGGCIAGASVGMMLTLGDKNMSHILSGYAFGGLIAGVFSPLGRFGCAASFILANAIASVYTGSTQEILTGLYEVMIATVLYMMLPEKFLSRFSAVFVPVRYGEKSTPRGDNVTARLLAAASALREVSDTVSQVGTKLKGISTDDISTVYTSAADITCERCGMRLYCWGTVYNDTMDALNSMTDTLCKNGQLKREDAPRHFAGRCCKLGDLLTAVNRCYSEYTARNGAQRRIDQYRSLLTGQFSSIAAFLKDLGEEFTACSCADIGGESIRSAISSCGLNVMNAVCCIDDKGRMAVQADIGKSGKTMINKTELLDELSSVCGRRMDGPFVSGKDDRLTLSFSQKPAFSVEFGQAFIQKSGEKLCGDAAESFIDNDGRAVMILSDGMGCGGSAAVDSNLTVGLMSSLMRSGFGFDSALKVVNSAMMLKSGDESLSTIDIASIDLYTGKAEFLKAGAPPTYIRRCGRVERVIQSSMPIGILQDVRLEKSTALMRKGDLIVIVSDGVVVGDDKWLVNTIEKFNGDNPEDFSRSIAAKAKCERGDGHDDDITVLAAYIR